MGGMWNITTLFSLAMLIASRLVAIKYVVEAVGDFLQHSGENTYKKPFFKQNHINPPTIAEFIGCSWYFIICVLNIKIFCIKHSKGWKCLTHSIDTANNCILTLVSRETIPDFFPTSPGQHIRGTMI